DGREMTAALAEAPADLIVLDLMLPGEDGLALCRRLRTGGSAVAVIMLTAKGDDADRITGLDAGADDYLPKPFNPRELVARIHAVLRRGTAVPAPVPADDPPPIRFGPFVLDVAMRRLERDGQPVAMTSGEFALLRALAMHAGMPLTRERLMELARGREYDQTDRAIDVQVSRVRKLIEDDPSKPRWLQTVWGLGYVFVVPPQ
ncbi:MAG: winged helix-turn-helix domain-containing protein, partial [Burkholderiales bacterium]|nr:winged helix-turn-helix domain-containing protein [Burkholderiales bacterium]